MEALDITEVARRSGLPASTLRYYEERGLINSTGRRGLHRVFDPAVLQRLSLIMVARDGGFALDEIARMFGADGQPHLDREMLTAKADELDRRIGELTAMRDGLRHAAACPAPSHLECPKFLDILGAAPAATRGRKPIRGR